MPATPATDEGRPPMAAPSEKQNNFSLATWNIRSGRPGGPLGGMEAAARALDSLNVDIAVLQETKVTGGVYTRNTSGYKVFSTNAPSPRQGGVAIAWRDEHPAFEVEEATERAANVLTFELVTAEVRWFVVGCYIPPSDAKVLDDVRGAV